MASGWHFELFILRGTRTMDIESGTAPHGAATPSKDKISTASTVPKYANFYHVYALAMTMTLAGIHVDWSYGLKNGFFIFLIGFLVISIGHISLVLCSAEMTGILPFSGGAYGFARVTLGPYIGYIVGYCDAYRCLTYVMRRLFTFGRMMELATDSPHKLQPLYWLLFLIPCILVDSVGSKSFWGLISVFGAVSLLATILYFLAASPQMDFDAYVLNHRDKLDFNVDFEGFLFASLSASRAYLGLAQLTLSCEETKEVISAVCCHLALLFVTNFFLFCFTIASRYGTESNGCFSGYRFSYSALRHFCSFLTCSWCRNLAAQ